VAFECVRGRADRGATRRGRCDGDDPCVFPSVFWGAKSAGGVLENGRFDLALTSWSPGLGPDRSYLFGCTARPPTGGNAGGYCGPVFDAAHAVLARDVPIVPIGFERSAYVVAPRFRHFRPNVLGRDYWNAWEWSLSGR